MIWKGRLRLGRDGVCYDQLNGRERSSGFREIVLCIGFVRESNTALILRFISSIVSIIINYLPMNQVTLLHISITI